MYTHHILNMDMFKKHRQDCELPKNVQFDIYARTSTTCNYMPEFQN